MVPDKSAVEVFHGVQAFAPPPLSARVQRRTQSEAARHLLAAVLARAPGPCAEMEEHRSISHSRGVAAAAIARGARVGIDVEYMCLRRDTSAILDVFLGPQEKPVSLAAFYRAWTFGEAYFKAFGRLPGSEALWRVIDVHAGDGASDGAYRVDCGKNGAAGVLHCVPFDDFALTIVWEMPDVAGRAPPDCPLGRPPECLVHRTMKID